MRDLDYDSTLQKLFTPGIVATLTQIHEGKGILPIASVTGHDTLEKLNEIAKTRDAGASCRLEGIKVTEKHLRELLDGKERANSDADKAVLGYRSVLETIDNSYSTLRISPAIILQLHSDLFRYADDVKSVGKWRGGDRARAASYGQTSFMPSDGPVKYHGIRTDLVSAPDVPAMMRELCNAYNNALRDKVYSPLLASIIFLLDFICIYPFDDGTGRMSRLLASLMFDKIDFTVGRYVSIDSELEATQDEYFGTMKASAEGWETGDNDYTPFVEYMLGVILKCYDELTERTREIATLKVLGFTPRETNGYIFRETILLTIIGALVGCVLGIGMESFVVVTAEVDEMMFGRDIHLVSFAIAFVLTIAFSFVVSLAMRPKIRAINMVESLKSVD